MASSTRRALTQKDIARNLGISVITVQRAMHGTGYVSAALKARIDAYIRKRDYRPHRAARTLATGTREGIALFSTREPESFWGEMRRGFSIAARQIDYLGFAVDYSEVPFGDTKAYLSLLKAAVKRKAAAVAVVNNHEYDMEAVFAYLDQTGVAYFTFNIDAPSSRRLCYVGPEYTTEGRIVGNYLSQVGGPGGEILFVHPALEAVSFLPGADITADRLRGIEAFCSEAGAPKLRTLLQPARGLVREATALLREQYGGSRRRLRGLYFPHLDQADAARLLSAVPPGVPVVTSLYSDFTLAWLREGRIWAIAFQDPVMQGYLTVKVIERFLATGSRPEEDRYLLTQALLLRENATAAANHFAFFDDEP